MKIYNSLDEIIGNTPLLRLRNTEKAHSLTARLFAKTEYFNPAGSVKDRTAKFMIDSAEKSGVLKRGMTLIEPTSGNTGIALAAIGASRGYKVILTMPETMSVERRKLISAYGAEIVLTDGKKGMAGAIEKAEQLKGELNGVILGQFVNPANVSAHFLTTGPEIWNDTDGNVDIFVAGVGTGGTVTGVGRYLKSKNEAVKNYRRRTSVFARTFKRQIGRARNSGDRRRLRTRNFRYARLRQGTYGFGRGRTFGYARNSKARGVVHWYFLGRGTVRRYRNCQIRRKYRQKYSTSVSRRRRQIPFRHLTQGALFRGNAPLFVDIP